MVAAPHVHRDAERGVSIHGCHVVAIEGTHSAGKTTLAAALTEHYRAAGVDAVYVADPARDSPLVAEVVADPGRVFDLIIEVDLLAATITQQIRAAHGRQLLIADKTVANVVAYARILLSEDERRSPALNAAMQLCRAWQVYDLVVRCTDRFVIDLRDDPYRAKVTQLQIDAEKAVAVALAEAEYPTLDLRAGLSTAQRVNWIVNQRPLHELRL
jgi:nicotinamide riboside kinase